MIQLPGITTEDNLDKKLIKNRVNNLNKIYI